jgi:xanthine dehydrogenase/oxidase
MEQCINNIGRSVIFHQHLVESPWSMVSDMHCSIFTRRHMQVGGSASLSNLLKACSAAEREQEKHAIGTLSAVKAQLKLFAGTQVRNVATVAGNIITGSPISDLNPIWVATNTSFTLQSLAGGERTVPAASFFLGYRCGTPGYVSRRLI